jgi:hypothetical protein
MINDYSQQQLTSFKTSIGRYRKTEPSLVHGKDGSMRNIIDSFLMFQREASPLRSALLKTLATAPGGRRHLTLHG